MHALRLLPPLTWPVSHGRPWYINIYIKWIGEFGQRSIYILYILTAAARTNPPACSWDREPSLLVGAAAEAHLLGQSSSLLLLLCCRDPSACLVQFTAARTHAVIKLQEAARRAVGLAEERELGPLRALPDTTAFQIPWILLDFRRNSEQ